MVWKVIFTPQAQKDAQKIKDPAQQKRVASLLNTLQENPFCSSPSYEKLKGNLNGCYSRRINIQHRLVYGVDKEKNTIKIIRMGTHYE